MSERKFIESEVVINSTMEKVWDALTNPNKTKQYMFGCEIISDLQAGSPILWQGEVEGEMIVFVKGHVVDVTPGRMLAYTTFDPQSEVPDVPENYLTVTYKLSDYESGVLLNVTQGDYNLVHDGEARFNDAEQGGGWYGLLLAIKEMVESE